MLVLVVRKIQAYGKNTIHLTGNPTSGRMTKKRVEKTVESHLINEAFGGRSFSSDIEGRQELGFSPRGNALVGFRIYKIKF